jgi:pimeloyl-ACP methyl ester carboxylesterase
MALRVEEHTAEIDGQPVFWRAAATEATPILYVHGVPTSSFIWVPFLERAGGIAPDLPGFGRSGKRGDLAYDIPFYARFIESFLDEAAIDRIRLVVNDWGAVGLAFAQRFPERIERLAIVDAVPLLPGYRWHRIARAWRRRGVGETLMGAINRTVIGLTLREASGTPGSMPDDFVDAVAEHFDEGTQRAILRLYRSADPKVLAAAGERLGEITAPTRIWWGEKDPYMGPDWADAYGERLPGTELVTRLAGAGHWPWYDQPELVDEIVAFLEA